MAKKHDVTGDQYFRIDGQMLEIKRQLRLSGGSSLDPELVKIALQEIVEGKFRDSRVSIAPVTSILRPISSGEKIMIEALDGKAYISAAIKTFRSYIGGNFKNWGLDQSGPATAETLLDVHEMAGDGTFAQIFTSLSSNLKKLVMTQAQIIRFCEKYPAWLRKESYATFFLTEVNDEYFVVSVYVHDDGLGVSVGRFEDGRVWSGEYRHRVVSPKLMVLAD